MLVQKVLKEQVVFEDPLDRLEEVCDQGQRVVERGLAVFEEGGCGALRPRRVLPESLLRSLIVGAVDSIYVEVPLVTDEQPAHAYCARLILHHQTQQASVELVDSEDVAEDGVEVIGAEAAPSLQWLVVAMYHVLKVSHISLLGVDQFTKDVEQVTSFGAL